jgi:hypothetical protein
MTDALPRLIGAHPNPFKSETRIGFSIPSRQRVHLAIYDVRGRLVKTLIKGIKDGGFHYTVRNGEESSAKHMSPGVYFCRFTTSHIAQTHKIVRIR